MANARPGVAASVSAECPSIFTKRGMGILLFIQRTTMMHDKINNKASDASIKIAIDFLSTMFGASESSRFFIGSRPNDDGEKIDSPYEEKLINASKAAYAKLPAFLREWDRPGRAMFFCVGILKAGASKRRKVNIAESIGLHADIDLKNIEIEKTIEDVVRKLMALRYPPSIIVSSGHGAHAYWLFKEPIPSTEMAKIERALKLLADMVGGDREPTHIAAFLRLPGSHNTKNGEWNEVKIVEQNTRRYELDDLEEMIGERAPTILRKERERQGTVNQACNAWEEYGKQFKMPTDIEARLGAMMYMGGDINGVHPTQRDVSSSMVSHGFEVEDIVERIIAATRIAAGSYGANWDWSDGPKGEETRVRNMTLTWAEKLEKKIERSEQKQDAGAVEAEDEEEDGDEEEEADDKDVGAPSMSEESIALAFADRHAVLLRHVMKWGYWLIWTSGHWVTDETVHAFDLARKICREAAAQSSKPKEQKIIASARTVAAVERLAKADRRIATATEQYDDQGFLFNCNEGE
jgi:hypothetical protein